MSQETDIVTQLSAYYDYAEVRIATLIDQENNKSRNRLIFSTINLLPKDFESSYTSDSILEDVKLGKIFFRRVVMRAEDALSWYGVENGTDIMTPTPLDSDKKSIVIAKASFTDDTVWGDFGIPFEEKNIFDYFGDNPAPFLGYSGSRNSVRVHRRFGNQDCLMSLIEDEKAIKFLEQCLHINFKSYSEYLGSMVLLLPNPIIESIENRLLSKEGSEKRLLKITPHPSQNLANLTLITFEVHLGFLKNVQSEPIPNDGIMTFRHNNPFQEDGFFILHNELGFINYKLPTSYLREMNYSIGVHSKTRDVHSKVSNRKRANDYNYKTSVVSTVSDSVIGEVTPDEIYQRVTQSRRQRQGEKLKKETGQRWFEKGKRKEALDEIGHLISKAKDRIIIFDPYFGVEQITQFTLRAETANIPIEIVTSSSVFEIERSKTSLYQNKIENIKQCVKKLFNKNISNEKQKHSLEKEEKIKFFTTHLQEVNKQSDVNLKCFVITDNKSMHDRFLVIDADIWFIGHSLNEIGNSNGFMVKVPVPEDIWEHLAEIKANALTFEDFYVKNQD